MTTAAAAVIDVLEQAGVTRFYTVPGESFLELMDEVERRPGLTLISTRHESGAAFMAEADAKVTGRPAVAMATRGVGAANLAIGVHTARQDSTPMLVLLGQVETEHLGKEAFQEVDLPTFFGEISVYGATVQRSDRAADLVAQALRASEGSRPGPAIVAFPADVLPGEGRPAAPPTRPTDPVAAEADVARAADILMSAQRPAMIVGEGAVDAHAELVALAEAFGLGVYAAFRRQDAFPNDHPLYLGHLTLGTPPAVLEPLASADVVLVLGSRLDEVTTQGFTLPSRHTRVIQIDRAGENLGRIVTPELSVHAAPVRVAQQLAEVAEQRGHHADSAWDAAHTAYLDFSDPGSPGRPVTQGVQHAEVLAMLQRRLPADTIVVNDAGNFSAFGHRYWRFTRPRTQVAPISGAMGYAVPAAIGAALAAPDRTVLALAGDGGFLMSGQEIETARRSGANPIIVIFQNHLYGTIAMHQARHVGRTAAVDIGHVDLEAFARSLGATARSVSEPGDLEEALTDLLGVTGPRVLVVHTDPDIFTPTTRLSDLMGVTR